MREAWVDLNAVACHVRLCLFLIMSICCSACFWEGKEDQPSLYALCMQMGHGGTIRIHYHARS